MPTPRGNPTLEELEAQLEQLLSQAEGNANLSADQRESIAAQAQQLMSTISGLRTATAAPPRQLGQGDQAAIQRQREGRPDAQGARDNATAARVANIANPGSVSEEEIAALESDIAQASYADHEVVPDPKRESDPRTGPGYEDKESLYSSTEGARELARVDQYHDSQAGPPGAGPAGPKYAPGYTRQLDLIDWLAGQAPTAEDLTYDAPTYARESLGLPTESFASQAQANPYAREAQQRTIERHREELQDRGMGPEDIAALTRIQRGAQDTRRQGERAIQQQLAAQGMTTGGSRIAQDMELANQVRQQATGQEGGVVRDYGDRGQQAAQALGQYGAGMGRQTFGEQFETAQAMDQMRRDNAGALTRREEDLRGMDISAALQAAQAPFQAHQFSGVPARMTLDMMKSELPVRRSERTLKAEVDRINAERNKGGSDWDLLGGLWDIGYGAVTANPKKIARGVKKGVGYVEDETNKPPQIKYKPPTWGGK